jgi:thiazole synthase ThiGH ThiG subunit
MARAMRHALEAGWWAAGAGRIGRKRYANASSPVTGLISASHAGQGIPGE